MLDKSLVEAIARNYLLKSNYPIVSDSGDVEFPEEMVDPDTINFFKEHNLACASFVSKYLDNPEHELDPGVYIVYVNILTGDVYMPPHM